MPGQRGDDADPERLAILALDAVLRAAGRQLARLLQVVARVLVVGVEGHRALERPDRRAERALAEVGVAQVEEQIGRDDPLPIELLVGGDGGGVVAAQVGVVAALPGFVEAIGARDPPPSSSADQQHREPARTAVLTRASFVTRRVLDEVDQLAGLGAASAGARSPSSPPGAKRAWSQPPARPARGRVGVGQAAGAQQVASSSRRRPADRRAQPLGQHLAQDALDLDVERRGPPGVAVGLGGAQAAPDSGASGAGACAGRRPPAARDPARDRQRRRTPAAARASSPLERGPAQERDADLRGGTGSRRIGRICGREHVLDAAAPRVAASARARPAAGPRR